MKLKSNLHISRRDSLPMRETILIIFIGNGGHFVMSFLDATGLGTFWGKLKNYFVSKEEATAPVTGLTDILTPVNLLPNSDFSRSGGYSSTMTWESVLLGNGRDYFFTNECLFRAYGTSLTNLTVTRAVNSLRFQATGTQITAIGIGQGFYCKANKIYTLIGKYAGTFNGTARIAMSGSPEIIYYSEDGTVAVFYYTTNYTTRISLYLDAPGTGDIDITWSDIALYEGEFKNPPFTTSLDVKPSNQFLLNQNSQTFYYLNQGVPSQSYIFNNYTNGSNTYEIESLKYVQRTSISGAQHTHFKCKCYLTTIFGNASGAFHNRNKLFAWDCYLSMTGDNVIVQNCDLTSTSEVSYISNPTLSMSGITNSGGILKFTLSFTHANYIYANNHYIFIIIPELMLPAENYEFVFPTTPISAKKL